MTHHSLSPTRFPRALLYRSTPYLQAELVQDDTYVHISVPYERLIYL